MDLGDLISIDSVLPQLAPKSETKKALLQDLAEAAAALAGLEVRLVFEALLTRERLGSTGVGRGIAIPHARIHGLKRIHCIFARLATPIDFESHDGEPVDLVFVLLAPEHAGADHLKALARISRLLREPATLAKLRSAKDRAALHAVLTEPSASHAA
jgi:PTS system nitrogen regulatory IIA component